MQCTLSLSLLLILILSASSFLYGFRNAAALTKGSRTPNNSNNILLMSNSNAATLTKNTKWRLSFSLMCEGYKPVDVLAQIRFINDKGYEPPQGKVFLEEDQNGLIRINNQVSDVTTTSTLICIHTILTFKYVQLHVYARVYRATVVCGH